jgi:hypothetical protein
MERRRVKHETSLERPLAQKAQQLKEEGAKIASVRKRDDLIRRARQAEIALHITKWLSSPGLVSPK